MWKFLPESKDGWDNLSSVVGLSGQWRCSLKSTAGDSAGKTAYLCCLDLQAVALQANAKRVRDIRGLQTICSHMKWETGPLSHKRGPWPLPRVPEESIQDDVGLTAVA